MTEPWELMLDCKSQGGNATIPAPPLCIVLLTYLRTEMAARTIKGIADNLDYPKELVSFYIADDGSPHEHMDAIYATVLAGGFKVSGYHNQKFQPGPLCGIGWNTALKKAYQISPYLMLLEDDWVLREPLDIRPYMWVLKENEKVGMIRLSNLTTDNVLQVRVHNGTHYFQYLRQARFCYSGNPHIRHLRFNQYYGFFDTDKSPGDIEVYFDGKFRWMKDGPNIWRPAALNEWGPFDHIGQNRMW
jgi:hypothetical protein